MSISTLESAQSRRTLDEQQYREYCRQQAEADLAFDFTRSIELGDPDAMPGWAGTTPDYDAARKLGIDYASKAMPRRRVTVAEAFAESLDYSNGPSTGDVVKVLSIAMKSADPIVALAARQLVERAAGKWATNNVDEVPA